MNLVSDFLSQMLSFEPTDMNDDTEPYQIIKISFFNIVSIYFKKRLQKSLNELTFMEKTFLSTLHLTKADFRRKLVKSK